MKANKLFFAAALVLALFFLSQFAAEMFFLAGPRPQPGKKFEEPALDPKDLSLSSRLHTETAFAWLEAGTRGSGDPAVQTSISLLRRALRRNPLDYQARYYLAKAYLRFSAVDNDYFDLGVRELKRSAGIRGSNTRIALDCAQVFFSIWPLLEEEDQRFASRLLADAMPELSWPEFSPLLEMWSLYVQDAPLLMALLQRKPEFFGPAADRLVAAGIPIQQRHELLALHEAYTLDALERRRNELSLQGEIGLDDARSLLNQSRQIKGYYRLQPGSKFSPEKLADFQRGLLLTVISGMLRDPRVKADPPSALQLREDILAYIAGHSELNSLAELQTLLEDNGFFKSNDFSSLYLKILIAYKKGNHAEVISEVENLRQTISFVKKEQSADYTAILLLLVDSYYSSRLLTAAESVAKELYANQPDNPDILSRVLRIRNILGSGAGDDATLTDKLAVVARSRFVTVSKPDSVIEVFLFAEPEIEITLDPVLRQQLLPRQLLRVFVDGRIAFESYGDAVPEKIAVSPPDTGTERKVQVRISIS